MTEWYYADRQRQQQGPVAAAELARLFQSGQVDAATLVWRDGLPEWRPLSGLREELGLEAAPTLDFRTLPAAPATEATPAEAAYAAPAAGEAAYSPYAAPSAPLASVDAGPVLGGEVVMAGFWKRAAANLLDSLVIGVIGGAIGMVLGMVAVPLAAVAGDNTGFALIGVQIVIQLISIAITAAYYAYFHASNSQATLGKMAIGIKVVRGDGSRIGLARGFGRYFAMLLSGLILGIGFLMAAFTERKQALHDMLCDTLVVDKWAYTDRPEWQRRELGGVTIAVLVIWGLLLAMMGIALVALIGVLSSMHW
ncbi:transporter [Pseudoxanthomonas broegbernensis]|uniref:Transporter n=1 Tax=Pseudoxanthomonas broegbernensis TaxID=83619 RepID=A0A7V8GKR8_9GAMM|nr:RDD family protein [Pseudoxanthomonas broegbernensis]KAF1685230.1 transporter [Pseudoxanthomonas broegbernensis]MBB6066116.1 putative RDD family membrane protein YckC [Pseudoxanthomonas broegbernensis]